MDGVIILIVSFTENMHKHDLFTNSASIATDAINNLFITKIQKSIYIHCIQCLKYKVYVYHASEKPQDVVKPYPSLVPNTHKLYESMFSNYIAITHIINI